MDEVRQDVGGCCDFCEHWQPNTEARVMGWCTLLSEPPADPLWLVLGDDRRAYSDKCGEYSPHPTLPEQLPEAGITIGEEG